MSEIFIIKNIGKGVINFLAPENVVPIKSAGSSDGGVITEDSDTVVFTGNGTAGNPLSAESVGGGTSDLTLEQARQNGNVLEGDVEIAPYYSIGIISKDDDQGIKSYFYPGGDLDGGGGVIGYERNDFTNVIIYGLSDVKINSDNPNYKGIIGSEEFDKQGDRKAFAQLSDVYDNRPYKVYTALMTQSGTDAPVATVLENTLGATITTSYISVGIYRLISDIPVFTINKTYSPQDKKGFEDDNSGLVKVLRLNLIDDTTMDLRSSGSNDALANQFIEIRVYN